jgi:hypothetical protein
MPIELYLIILIVALAALYFVVPFVAGTYLKFRGERIITCPETRNPAGVEVDSIHAALTAPFNYPDLRLKSCSRWIDHPELAACGQECLLQIEIGPEDCLVRHILASWYRGKYCASCGREFGEIQWMDHKPALLSPDGKTVEWSEVPAEKIPDVLKTHFPVCWDCHITETFCREYPDLIVDRSHVSEGVHRDIAH